MVLILEVMLVQEVKAERTLLLGNRLLAPPGNEAKVYLASM